MRCERVAMLLLVACGCGQYLAHSPLPIRAADDWSAVGTLPFSAVGDLAFSTAENGVVADPGGLLGVTLDGGTTWREIASEGLGSVQGLRVFDSLRGAVWSTTTVLVTDDAGLSWQPLPGPGVPATLLAVTSPAAGVYYELTAAGAAYMTSDAGADWSDVTPDYLAGEPTDVQFSDPENGWIVQGRNGALQTSNSGGTWTALSLPGQVLRIGVSGQTLAGFFVDSNGAFFAAVSAGGSVDRRELPVVPRVGALSAVYSPSAAAYVAGDGRVFATGDGGQRWMAVSLTGTGANGSDLRWLGYRGTHLSAVTAAGVLLVAETDPVVSLAAPAESSTPSSVVALPVPTRPSVVPLPFPRRSSVVPLPVPSSVEPLPAPSSVEPSPVPSSVVPSPVPSSVVPT